MKIKNLNGDVIRTVEGDSLKRANLTGADLRYAYLTGADLTGADLTGADLTCANLTGATLPNFQIVPDEGAFIGYKKLHDGTICKVQIPVEAKRTSSLVGRKCRAEFVDVLEGDGYSKNSRYKVVLRPRLAGNGRFV